MLLWQPIHVIYYRAKKKHEGCDVITTTRDSYLLLQKKKVLRVSLVLSIKYVWISFEPLGRFS
jgi:hypothetical protein